MREPNNRRSESAMPVKSNLRIATPSVRQFLLEIARRVARHRVVVKRWLHAPPVAPKPTVQYKGQSIRYDAYLIAALRAG